MVVDDKHATALEARWAWRYLTGILADASLTQSTVFWLGYYSDADAPFAGGELLFRLAPSFYFNPNLEVVFRDDSFLSVSADFHYDFHRRSGTSVWAGAGLGILAVNPPGPRGGDTDVGLNLLFGVAFPRRSLTPYLQAKVVAKQDSEFSLGIGLRF